ncbi:hypothetical protein Tco_1413862 [Tanacetum coccineum]
MGSHSGFTSQLFNQSQHTPNPPLDKEDSSLDKILDDLFTIGAENIKKIEHKVPNRCDDITDYEDSDHEDGELPDLPTFSATNEFASICEQVLTSRGCNSRSPRLVLCGKVVAEIQQVAA